jgi:phosphopantothenoylcysteine decarboxylase/phosphopantothenate--cysteine ligase
MSALINKHILLGVTGGVAAYKSAELVRRLRESGAEVRVVMTDAATQFVTPLTFQALSGSPTRVALFDFEAESAMGHIDLARWADAILVAPATANFLARLTQGLADDLLTSLCLAFDRTLLVAPAMNRTMWANAATQANVALLRERGICICGPAAGEQACGETGPGRMLEVGELLSMLLSVFESDALAGVRVLMTAGPTREAIDPVRFISNRSSGKMGFAMARAAAEAGADVTLVTGPVALGCPERVGCVPVVAAEDMYANVMQRVHNCDIFIAAAAVADYRVASVATQKIKKSEASPTLQLVRNPDILAAVAQGTHPPFTVGFAAETERLVEHARAKRMAKSLNMVVANQVGMPGAGFDSDNNTVHVFWEGGDLVLPLASKDQIARQLTGMIATYYRTWVDHKLAGYDQHAEDSA